MFHYEIHKMINGYGNEYNKPSITRVITRGTHLKGYIYAYMIDVYQTHKNTTAWLKLLAICWLMSFWWAGFE